MGPGGFFLTNPDLADLLGRTDLNFDNCYFKFCMFWTPTFWISRSPNLQISGFPGPQISKFLDFQVPRFPDFQTPSPADEFSDPNPTSLPTHPGIKDVARALAAMLHVPFLAPLFVSPPRVDRGKGRPVAHSTVRRINRFFSANRKMSKNEACTCMTRSRGWLQHILVFEVKIRTVSSLV